jgi:hypothetical protein
VCSRRARIQTWQPRMTDSATIVPCKVFDRPRARRSP